MKTTQRIMTTVLLWIAMFGGTAHAATTTKIYSSGVLVIGFLALCALVLVVQLIPAIMTVVGMIKGAAHKKEVASYK